MRRWLAERSDLLPLVIRFNYLPAIDLHPDHIEPLSVGPAQLFMRLIEHPRGVAQLSRMIIAKANLETPFTDFRDPVARIVLLPKIEIEKLVSCVAAAAIAPSLMQLVSKTDRGTVRASLGETAWEFALSGECMSCASHVQKYLAAIRWPGIGGDVEQRLQAYAQIIRRFLMDLLGGFPNELVKRMQLKFPLDAWRLENQSDHSALPQQSTVTHAAWALLQHVMRTELDARWQLCFK